MRLARMPGCMDPMFAIQEQPLCGGRNTTDYCGDDLSKLVVAVESDCSSSKAESFSTVEMNNNKDSNRDPAQQQIASLQNELYRERSLMAQYREEWDAVRNTLAAARRQNETVVKERDVYQKHVQVLQSKLSSLETKFAGLQKERDALSFLSRTIHSSSSDPRFPSLPALQSSLKEVVNKVGSYMLERELRKGETGNLVPVHSKNDLNLRFAMKVVNKSKIQDYESLRQLDREVAVLKKLQPHANIVQLHEVLHGYRAFYMVFEQTDMNLREYHTQYAAPHHSSGFNSSNGWLKQAVIGVAQALVHLHAHKIAHLDVKPESIQLVGLGRVAEDCVPLVQADHVRLSGFEACVYQKDFTTMHKDGMRLSTLGYFAPDVALSRSSVDGAACDMWSLGATLLDLTTGFCDGWMTSYEDHAVDVSKFEAGLCKCLKDLKEKGLAWYKDADLKDLLVERLLVLPTLRATAQQVLQHKWLSPVKKDVVWV
ncbi:hypothetical protein MPSEU_000825300 [Mayamaea pseudoterrestris]|nr:hypothetical protein MPSEU_000825300 [Mayamaea pseudoterrestris]